MYNIGFSSSEHSVSKSAHEGKRKSEILLDTRSQNEMLFRARKVCAFVKTVDW